MNSHSKESPWEKSAESSTQPAFSDGTCNLAPQEIIRLEHISHRIKELGFVGSRMQSEIPEEKSDFTRMAELLSIYYEPEFTSHRRFLGPTIVFAKRLFLKFFNKWLMTSLVKQKELNHRLFDVALTVRALELRIQALENQVKGHA